MPSPKEREKEEEFRAEVIEHAVAVMNSGSTREAAIANTRIKYDLPLKDLEEIVPYIETEEVSKKDEGRLMSKADGVKILVKR